MPVDVAPAPPSMPRNPPQGGERGGIKVVAARMPYPEDGLLHLWSQCPLHCHDVWINEYHFHVLRQIDEGGFAAVVYPIATAASRFM